MRNKFDHLAKQIGKEALSPSGATSVHDEISPETQHADLRHNPDPARQAERDRLGLLGRIASVLCLIEIYGHAPNAEEFRACLAKQLAFWQKRAREARAHNNKRRRDRQLPSTGFVDPTRWIIAAGHDGHPGQAQAQAGMRRQQRHEKVGANLSSCDPNHTIWCLANRTALYNIHVTSAVANCRNSALASESARKVFSALCAVMPVSIWRVHDRSKHPSIGQQRSQQI